MEVKKDPKIDLEKKRTLFILLGFVIVLSVVNLAFEWTSMDLEETVLVNYNENAEEEEMVPITRPEPPPPPPPPPQVVEVLTIVEDDVEIEEELEMDDTEVDENTEIEIIEVEEEDEVVEFMIIEDKPEFPGGSAAMMKYVASHTQYPVIAKENGVSGKVFIYFVIGKDGKVTKAKVLRGVDKALDDEALRVVNSMPAWKPGKQRGRAVPCSFRLPVNFRLSN